TAIKVYNILGEMVYETIPSEMEDGSETLDLSHLNNGLYNVMVMNGNLSSSYKLVLQN
ncbi:MAG: Secretion system C-terminal sorting domain, partial [Bacteroidota bacterium]